jgi:hypothetical protein
MIRISAILILALTAAGFSAAQPAGNFMFRGQLSGWFNVNPSNDLPLWTGIRYIPAINYGIPFGGNRLIDIELSPRLSGTAGMHPFDRFYSGEDIRPYRAWARYSSSRFEIRAGLQKINFGSATLVRPLMWFDQVDPRDPLQLTDGVWGVLGRYYFLNNVNIWVWGLYGNEGPKTWETGVTRAGEPEFGGRLQVPVPRGETAISFHHRKTGITETDFSQMSYRSFLPGGNSLAAMRTGGSVSTLKSLVTSKYAEEFQSRVFIGTDITEIASGQTHTAPQAEGTAISQDVAVSINTTPFCNLEMPGNNLVSVASGQAQTAPQATGTAVSPGPAGSINSDQFYGQNIPGPGLLPTSENRIGFDGRWDVGIGLWAEGAWLWKGMDAGLLTNQHIMTIGADYTFGIGNGIHTLIEQVLISVDRQAFRLGNRNHFTAASLSYPIGILDNISAIIYVDWTGDNIYSFVNWHRQFNRIGFYLMGFWNPETLHLPQQPEGAQMFSGRGIQFMLVFNH